MPILKRTPINTGRYAAGTGIYVSSLTNLEDPTEEPRALIRYILKDPENTSDTDVGVPLYQMTLSKSYYEDALTVGPSHVALMHCDKLEKILAVGIFPSGDWQDTDDWLQTYADVTAVDHAVVGGGYTMASVPVLEPVGGFPDEYLTTVLSVPSASDHLGVTVLPKDISGHVVAAAADISGTDLGFSGSEILNWRWTGFVARRSETTPDEIIVSGGLEKMDTVRKGPGDLSGSANYTFVVRESDGGLVSGAVAATVDVPFTPHQIVEGTPNDSEKTYWAVGRVDPEFVNPSVSFQLASVDASNALALGASIGIWATTDPQLGTWERLWQSPIGINSPPVHHLDNAVVAHKEVPRDLGLMYSGLYQRMIPFTIDNDSGQDPVTETPKRSTPGTIPV